jgi:peptide-methionine (S)-S-oxide reductase
MAILPSFRQTDYRSLQSCALLLCMIAFSNLCFGQQGKSRFEADASPNPVEGKESGCQLESATLGGGCFWCIEAVFQRIHGVSKVVSGYAGGNLENPTYKAVCTGRTGHAEVCQVEFDASIVSFEEILLIFFKSHDPTTWNQQGPDFGTQYRSVVFYHDEAQRIATEKLIAELTSEKVFGNKKIITELSPLPAFYSAEDYHQNYFNSNRGAKYCQVTIAPKVEKFERQFKDKSKLQKEREAKKNSKG